MKRIMLAAMAAALTGVVSAQTLQISFGTRETGSTGAIGTNGGASGGIEWIDLDLNTLTLDGTWQMFSFDMDASTVTGFAGASANGVLEGVSGTLEHIRIRNNGDVNGPIRLYIDDVTDTVDSGPVNFGDFEGFSADDEVMFQEPGFSGSTSGNIDLNTDFAGVDNTVAHSGSGSYRVEFDFLNDTSATTWVRMTTFNTAVSPNPIIRYDQNSVVSFWIRGQVVPEPAAFAVLGLGALALMRRRRR